MKPRWCWGPTFIAKPFFSTGQLFDSQGTLRATLPVRRKADTHTCNVRGIGALDGKAIPFQHGDWFSNARNVSCWDWYSKSECFFSTRQIFANLNLVPCSRIARLRWVSHVLELCFLGRTFQPWKTFFTTWRIFFKSGCAFNPLAVFRRCKHFFNFTVLFSACCPSSFQLREAFFLPCLVPLGFFVRLLSRHGGDAQTWHYFKYRGRRSIWWMSWKVAEASQKSYFLSSVKMALQEKLARNRQVSICQCIGCPSHRRSSTLATTSSGTCHSQQK